MATDFDVAVSRTNTANCRAKVIVDGRLVQVLPLIGGEVTCDRTAAQRTSFDVEIPGAALAPNTLDDLLAPGNTRIQVERAVRVQAVDTRTAVNGRGHGWTVSDQSTGVMNGLSDFGGLLALGYVSTVQVAQAIESDTAHPIISLQVVPVVQAVETDTAGAVNVAPAIAQAVETDTAQSIAALQVVPVAQAVETDTAGEFTTGAVVAQAVETETAQPISFTQFVLIDTATETNTAGPVTSAVVLGQAVEVDEAQGVTPGSQIPYPSESLFPSETLFPAAP
jgi:hypothetical protein